MDKGSRKGTGWGSYFLFNEKSNFLKGGNLKESCVQRDDLNALGRKIRHLGGGVSCSNENALSIKRPLPKLFKKNLCHIYVEEDASKREK